MPDLTPFDPPAQFAKSTTPPTAFTLTPGPNPAPSAFTAARAILADVAALKALATVALPVATTLRQVASAVAGEVMQVWRLVASTHADDVPGGFARPTDYAAGTNEKVWSREI